MLHVRPHQQVVQETGVNNLRIRSEKHGSRPQANFHPFRNYPNSTYRSLTCDDQVASLWYSTRGPGGERLAIYSFGGFKNNSSVTDIWRANGEPVSLLGGTLRRSTMTTDN